MILAERHIIKKQSFRFKALDNLCFLSKNLYNAALYAVRQHYFEHHKFLSYANNVSMMAKTNNIDYRALPAKISQYTLKLVEQNFKSFFNGLHSKIKAAKLPKYLGKDGRQVVIYTKSYI